MASEERGFGYFDIVRAAIHLVSDPPSASPIRVDPDGERKVEDRRRCAEEWAAEKRAHGIVEHWDHPDFKPRPTPPLKTLHLQWYGGEDPKWHDERLHINLETKRLYNDGSGIPFLGRGRHGSGAIGVLLFGAPVLLLFSPYLVARAMLYRSREDKVGMSRHAIALFKKLRGELDVDTATLLETALKNEWAAEQKMRRRVSIEEAYGALSACRLKVNRYGVPGEREPCGVAYYWIDSEGDCIARMEIQDKQPDPPELRVMGSRFTGEEALKAATYFREIDDRDSDD